MSAPLPPAGPSARDRRGRPEADLGLCPQVGLLSAGQKEVVLWGPRSPTPPVRTPQRGSSARPRHGPRGIRGRRDELPTRVGRAGLRIRGGTAGRHKWGPDGLTRFPMRALRGGSGSAQGWGSRDSRPAQRSSDQGRARRPPNPRGVTPRPALRSTLATGAEGPPSPTLSSTPASTGRRVEPPEFGSAQAWPSRDSRPARRSSNQGRARRPPNPRGGPRPALRSTLATGAEGCRPLRERELSRRTRASTPPVPALREGVRLGPGMALAGFAAGATKLRLRSGAPASESERPQGPP